MERKRFCSFILSLVLLLTMMPVGVYAEDPAGTGTLTISSSPAGADVYINDVLQTAVTPCELLLNPSSYNLKLSIPGYQDYVETVAITEGAETAVEGIVQLPDLIDTVAANIITVNSGGDSNPDSSVTVEQVKAQETITLRDAVTAILNDESGEHFRVEFAPSVSVVELDYCININHRGNLTINGDCNRDGAADVNIAQSASFLNWLGAVNVIASDTYITGLKFDGSAKAEKSSFLSIRVPDESTDTYNIDDLHVLGCEFTNNYEIGVATCGSYGHGASGYGAAGTTNFSNLVFAGNTFNKAGLFSFAGAGDEDYNVIDGYIIAANQFVNCGIGMLSGDAHTWYVYGQDNAQGNGGVPGQIEYCENNILRNVLISGNRIQLDNQAGETYTTIIGLSGANLGNSGNLVDTVTIRNNTSIVLDPANQNLFASLTIGNVSIGDGGNLPNYSAPEFVYQTSNNIVRNVTMQYNDFQLGGGREFLVYNVTTDVGDQEGSGNLFQNIRISSNRFDSPKGVSIANYTGKSQCGTCSGNNIEDFYFTNNTVTTTASTHGARTGIVVANAFLSNLYGSPVTDIPDYSGSMENIFIDGNTVTGDYQYGIVAAGSAGDYAEGMGIDSLSVSNNNVALTHPDSRFGIVAAGATMGTFGDPGNSAPYQLGSTSCFLTNATVTGNAISAKGGIAVAGDLYEDAPRDVSIAGNHIDTITVQANSIIKQSTGEANLDLPGVLVSGIVDMWDRLALTTPTMDGNRVTAATLVDNTVTGFDAGKSILNLNAVNDVYPVGSPVTSGAILSNLTSLTDDAYGEASYLWAWVGTPFDSSTEGGYLAKASRQSGMGMDAMYYEIVIDPSAYEAIEGTARINTNIQFLAAMNDVTVSHIIAESVELDIQQGIELTKDLTISTSASLRISEGSFMRIPTGVTLTLDGNTAVRPDAELRIGGTLVNNAELIIGGAMSVAAPAVIVNNGTVVVTDDPERGFGRISFFDKISDTGSPGDPETLPVTLTGSGSDITGGAVEWIADVNGPNSLDYAMNEDQYTGIWVSEFHDEGDPKEGPTTGVSIVYPGDLIITKPLDIFENDSFVVNGNLTVAGPEGKLYIGGGVSVLYDLINNNGMLIEGCLNVNGTAINNGNYTQTVGATVNTFIEDVGDGDHMKGYYLTNQSEWETALADSAHCNPIVIGMEAVSPGAIVITTDTAITSNIFVDGDLIINEGVTFTLNMRYDGAINGVRNEVSGELINYGTLEMNAPLNVFGKLKNTGTLKMARYDGNENSQDWTQDGSIVLSTWIDDHGILPDKNGYMENNGTIINKAKISINGNSHVINKSGGWIEGGTIGNWGVIPGANIYPFINEGFLKGTDVQINYTHLSYRYLDKTGSGWYEKPSDQSESGLFEQPGHDIYMMFGMWDYDIVVDDWAFSPVTPGALSVSSGSGIVLESLDSSELSSDPTQDVSNSAAYVRMTTPVWGDHEISYTAPDMKMYRMAATVDIPPVGYYTGNTASRETYLNSATYTPDAGYYFYAIVNGDFSEDWTSHFDILEGENRVDVTTTSALNIYKVTVNDGTKGNFGLNLRITLDNVSTGEQLIPECWIDVNESPTEGLVFNWADWRTASGGAFDYPVPQTDAEGIITINTSMKAGVGGATVPLFYRHLSGDVWVNDPVTPSAIIIPSGSGIEIKEWSTEGSGAITDQDYLKYKFAEIYMPNFGSYELGYDTGTQIWKLPLSVVLPDVGYYKEDTATQDNYINEFFYADGQRTFYLIGNPNITTAAGWTCEYEFLDGSDRVDITTTGALGVFLVTVKDTTEGDARVNVKLRYFDEAHSEHWQSQRDIFMHEAEVPGLVYSWTDWKNGSNDDYFFRYPIVQADGISYNTQARVNKGPVTWIMFYKSWSEATQTWIYTQVDASQVSVSDGTKITKDAWSDPLAGAILESDLDHKNYKFTNFNFSALGRYTISYTVDEGAGAVTYNMLVDVTLPDLGAYSTLAGGEENWMAEVPFDQYRSVYLIPTVALSAMDLSQSTFYLPDGEGEIPYDYDEVKTFSKPGYGSVTAHETEGVVDYFTMDITALPFDPDFDLGIRLRNAENQEIIGTTLRFCSDLPDAPSALSGITLATPTAAGVAFDAFTSLMEVPAESVRYVRFVSGALAGNGYRFNLTGDSTGTRLYLFDSSGRLLDQSSFENLSEEGRALTIFSTTLTQGADYYLAVHNESGVVSNYELSAGLRAIPATPTATLENSDLGTIGLSVSGATNGQNYILYANIDGEWQWRGSEPYDANQNPRFVHAFDMIYDGETATALAVAIEEGGVEGPRAQVAVNITRTDTQSAGMAVTLMDFPESENAYLKASGLMVFPSGSYYRLHHEDATGYWNYNGSFFGDGSSIAAGGAFMDESGVFDTGFWLLTEYMQTGSGITYTIGWETHIDSRGIPLGTLTRENFDILTCSIDAANKKVDASVTIRTLTAPTPATVDIYMALYDSTGRLIDIVLRDNVALDVYGAQDNVPLFYTDGHEPASCKAFVLDEELKPYFENQEVVFLK